jgi:hypothetical protein
VAVRVDTLSTAVPLLESAAEPRVVEPFRKLTVPVGVSDEPELPVTVAVRVIVWPELNDVGDAVRLVVDGRSTVTVTAGAVLVVKLLSPSYVAVTEFVPSGTNTFESTATPPLRFAVPSDVVPLKNSTVPVGAVVSVESAEVTVAWSVIGWPETIELAEAERLAHVWGDPP